MALDGRGIESSGREDVVLHARVVDALGPQLHHEFAMRGHTALVLLAQ